jgi:hypothetical protein
MKTHFYRQLLIDNRLKKLNTAILNNNRYIYNILEKFYLVFNSEIQISKEIIRN